MKYLPFLDGQYSVAPGLAPMQKAKSAIDGLVFQVDEHYTACLQNKQACREENIHKYFCADHFLPRTAAAVNRFIFVRLLEEYPDRFTCKKQEAYHELVNCITGERLQWHDDFISVIGDRYVSLFDALCSQLQEDLAVCQLADDTDRMAAIHLCAPNHWAAADKVGKSFDAVHAPVPGMEKTMQHYPKMLATIVQKGPYTRFAWGIATDRRLNHHPQPPAGADPMQWYGRAIDENISQLYVRVERQNLIGLPEVNAFLFTIRTYFYDVNQLMQTEKNALMAAVSSMSPQSLLYKGLTGKVDLLRSILIT